MRKIYIITFCLLAAFLSSCNDWLDVRPSDEIKEEFLFETGNGYRNALNGIYRKMATFNVYGSNLSWGLIDAWGQVYCLTQCSDDHGGKAMKKIMDFKFKDSDLTPTTDAMWDDAWNIVANCNNLIQQVENADTLLFYDKKKERDMILGEALALRAYVQFDLLRIYAPSLAMNPGERTFIPYVESYPAYLENRQTVSYCLNHIISDLVRAQSILEPIDKNKVFSTNRRFITTYSGEAQFTGYRGYRLNYYAVTGVLARVYLYAQLPDKAYEAAKILIDEENENGYFAAKTSDYSIRTSGNLKMFDDLIFALYSTDLIDWNQDINEGKDKYDSHFMAWSSDKVDDVFGEDKNKDWRNKYQMEFMGDYYLYRMLKYSKQNEATDEGKENNRMIPMIRMSEIYYIAAEAIFDKDKEEAQGYLEKVKKGRGVKLVLPAASISDVSKEQFIDLMVNDAQREFMGEGQTFFMYKRLMRILKDGNYRNDIAPSETNFVLPLPDTESNI